MKTLLTLLTALSVTLIGLSLTLAFGMLAFIGVPILAVGLGLLSAAIDDIE